MTRQLVPEKKDLSVSEQGEELLNSDFPSHSLPRPSPGLPPSPTSRVQSAAIAFGTASSPTNCQVCKLGAAETARAHWAHDALPRGLDLEKAKGVGGGGGGGAICMRHSPGVGLRCGMWDVGDDGRETSNRWNMFMRKLLTALHVLGGPTYY